MTDRKRRSQPTSFDDLSAVTPGSDPHGTPASNPSQQQHSQGKAETTKLHISAIDADVVDELRGFVLWLMSQRGRDGMKSYADVIEKAWKKRAQHYRRKFHQGKKFTPTESLPPGRKAKTTHREGVEYTRLTVSGVDVDVANELRGMIWVLMQSSKRDGLNSLGDVVADMLQHYLPEAAEKYNEGRGFGGGQQVPPGRKK